MSLQQQLLDKVIQIQKAKKENPQKVLDSVYFGDLSAQEKIDFINSHKDILRQKPKFQWSDVAKGAGSAGFLATTGTLMHQFATKVGPGGLKPNTWALGSAAVLGSLVGGVMSASKAHQDYTRDVTTQKNIDDAISMLVSRNLQRAPTKTDYVSRIMHYVEDAPLTAGKALSDIDFDSLDNQ